MKAVIEFQLPEEATEHLHAINGLRYFSILEDTKRHIRSQVKHAELSSQELLLLQGILEVLNEE